MFDYKPWYSQNRDRLLTQMRFYRQQHANQFRVYRQYYYTNDKEYVKEAHRLYVEQHRDRIREYNRTCYSNNKEYYKTLYETNKPKRLDTNRYNYIRIKEQRPDIYIARIRKKKQC